jgi:predicted transcriptional regulator
LPGVSHDPAFRIGILPAANKKPTVVCQDDALRKAITIMVEHDFSQLPVMQGEREVKGVITWKSISSRLLAPIGSQLTADNPVRDYCEDAKIVEANQPLFESRT